MPWLHCQHGRVLLEVDARAGLDQRAMPLAAEARWVMLGAPPQRSDPARSQASSTDEGPAVALAGRE
jgi:hypothetical protein